MESRDKSESLYALQVAFQTMKERCQQLQARLTTVEEENMHLRLQNGKNNATNAPIKISRVDENSLVQEQKVCNYNCILYIMIVIMLNINDISSLNSDNHTIIKLYLGG